MVLSEDIFDDRGSLLLENGIPLTNTYLARLKRLGIPRLRVFDPYAASLKPPLLPAGLWQALTVYSQTLLTLKWQSLNMQQRYLYLQRLNTLVTEVISHLESQLPAIINLPVRQPTEDEVSHAVNVCLLSIITGFYLRLPAAVLSEIAVGALFHDIGKTALAEKVPLADRYLHTIYGRDLLLSNKLSPIAARIAVEHHERPDVKGHPYGFSEKYIHTLSRIVAIANYYDRAISRENEMQVSRQEMVESMLASGNVAFDLVTLRVFSQTIAVYPVGCLVKLNDSRLAYVLKNKARLPLRPRVELADASRTEIDLALRPTITIAQLIAE